MLSDCEVLPKSAILEGINLTHMLFSYQAIERYAVSKVPDALLMIVQAFRGVWRMKEGQQGEQTCRLSYSLFVRPQV